MTDSISIYEQYNIDLNRLSRDYLKFPLDKKEKPLKEDILYLYIELNLSIKDLSIIFNRCEVTITNFNRYYNIKKPKELQIKLAEKTWIKKYGVRCARQSEIVKSKIRQTMTERFGRDNYFKGEEGKKAAASGVMKKFGRSNYFKGKEGREAAEKSCLKKYGTVTPLLNDECKEKTKLTCREKFNNDSFAGSE